MKLTYDDVGIFFQRAIDEHASPLAVAYARVKIGQYYLSESELPDVSDEDRDMLWRLDSALSWTSPFSSGEILWEISDVSDRVFRLMHTLADVSEYVVCHWERLPDGPMRTTWPQSVLRAFATSLREKVDSLQQLKQGTGIVRLESKQFHALGENAIACMYHILGHERGEQLLSRLNGASKHLNTQVSIANLSDHLLDTDLPSES